MFNSGIIQSDLNAYKDQAGRIQQAISETLEESTRALYKKYIETLEASQVTVAAGILKKIRTYNPQFLTQAAT